MPGDGTDPPGPHGDKSADKTDDVMQSEPTDDGTDSSDTDDIVRSIGKSGIVVFLGTFLELGIAFVVKLLVAQSLVPASYGEVTVALTVLNVTAIISRLGFATGIPRNAPRYEGADRRGVLVSALQLNLLVSTAIGIAIFVAAGLIADWLRNPALIPVLRVIAVGVPAIPLMRISLSGTQAVGRSSPKVIVQNLTHPLIRIVFVVLAIAVGSSPVTVVAAYVAANWVGAIAAIYFLIRYTTILDSSIGWTPKHREMLHFSLPLMATTGIGFLLGNTDTLMIQYFQGSADVGVYDIGYTVAQMLSVGLGSLSYLFLPNISELHAESKYEEIVHLYKLVTKWAVFVTLPMYLLLIFFPSTLIAYTFGPRYSAAAPYLVILATGYFSRVLVGPGQQALSAFDDTQVILKISVLAAALNIILNASLLLTVGTIGAAVASSFSLVVMNACYAYWLHTTYEVNSVSRSLVGPVVVFVAVSGTIYAVVRTTVGRPQMLGIVALLAVTGVVYVLSILSFGGLQEDDVMLVRSAEQRLGIDLEPIKRVARLFL